MKLLIVSDLYFPEVVGGGERVLYETSTRLSARGHRVGLLVRRQEGAPEEEELKGCHVYRFSPKRPPGRFNRRSFCFISLSSQ